MEGNDKIESDVYTTIVAHFSEFLIFTVKG